MAKSKRIPINPGWPHYNKWTLPPAVKKGNMLFISGIDATERDPVTGEIKATGDMGEQCRNIFQKIDRILKLAGGSWDDVVKTVDYVTTWENYKATAQVRRDFFGTEYGAATGILVKGLVGNGALIEIDAVAVLD
ncbi:MAG: RidA family protein [Dehalococcoidia bacterium]|nr:RidA family protein [Dehalococcoidia bacterium]